MFFACRDLFSDFFQISDMHPKPYMWRHIRAKFRVNRLSDSLEIRAGEKKEKAKQQKRILPKFRKTAFLQQR